MSRRREAAELALALSLSTQPAPLLQTRAKPRPPYLFSSLTPTTTQDSRELELRPYIPSSRTITPPERVTQSEDMLAPRSSDNGVLGGGSILQISPIQSFTTPNHPPSIPSSHLGPSGNIDRYSNFAASEIPRSSPIVPFPLSHLPSTGTSGSEKLQLSPTEVSIIPSNPPSSAAPLLARPGSSNENAGGHTSSRAPITYGRQRTVSPIKRNTPTKRDSLPRKNIILSPDTGSDDDLHSIGKPRQINRRIATSPTSDSEAEEMIEELNIIPAVQGTMKRSRSTNVQVVLPTSKTSSTERINIDNMLKRSMDSSTGSRGGGSPDPLDSIPRKKGTRVENSSPSRAFLVSPNLGSGSRSSGIPTSAEIRSGSIGNKALKSDKPNSNPKNSSSTSSSTSLSAGRKSARQAQAEAEKLERERQEAEAKRIRREKRLQEKEAQRLAELTGARPHSVPSSSHTSTSTKSITPASTRMSPQIITIEDSLPPVSKAKVIDSHIPDKGKKRIRELVMDGEPIVFIDPDSVDDGDFVVGPKGKKAKGKVAAKGKGKAKTVKGNTERKGQGRSITPRGNVPGEVEVESTRCQEVSTEKEEVARDASVIVAEEEEVVASVPTIGNDGEVEDEEEGEGKELEGIAPGSAAVQAGKSRSISPIKLQAKTPARSPLRESTPNSNVPIRKYAPGLFKVPMANGSSPSMLNKPKLINWKAPRDDLQQVLQKFPGAKSTGMSRRLKIAPLHSKIGPPAKSLPPLPVRPVKKKKGDSDEEEEEEEEEEDEEGNMVKKSKGPKSRGMEWYMVED